ncbi:hypothetical protein PR001_g26276 [Phytophthora rubi]|uniref:Uncharacterized protein n=1 Tax=Phytophthora rubi TaxID=129364 RepID=A0A6A3HSI1_9STRA|nr:hypothetical protein PR001_g26276 [Phytophthora rubi]
MQVGLPGAARRAPAVDADARAHAGRCGEGEHRDGASLGVPHAKLPAVQGPVARGAAPGSGLPQLAGENREEDDVAEEEPDPMKQTLTADVTTLKQNSQQEEDMLQAKEKALLSGRKTLEAEKKALQVNYAR